VFDHHTYVLASDGDMMEGVQAEAASLAGHLELGKLIVLYDANRVTLSGTTSITFTEDVGARYRSYGWHVQRVDDGNDLPAITRAIQAARDTRDQPSLIIVHTVIGFGAPTRAGTFAAHGAPLGAEEVKKTKANLGWPEEPPFYIPDPALRHMRSALERGTTAEDGWKRRFADYRAQFPALADEIERRFRTARRTRRSSRCCRCASFRASSCCAPATRTRRASRGRSPSSARTDRRRSCSRASTCRPSIATCTHRRKARGAAPTCSTPRRGVSVRFQPDMSALRTVRGALRPEN
jgi:transketolase